MNLEKFNPNKVKDLPLRKYNLMLLDGRYMQCMELEYVEDGPMTQTVYYFVSTDRKTKVTPKEVDSFCRYIQFDYVAVGNGFALTKNGSKTFRENVYGVIDNEQYAQHFIINMNNNANTYTPDTINRNDIVECIDGHFYNGEKAIVTEVRKPYSADDHGTVEVYMLDKKFFEHFTYTGWNKFLKVVENYD